MLGHLNYALDSRRGVCQTMTIGHDILRLLGVQRFLRDEDPSSSTTVAFVLLALDTAHRAKYYLSHFRAQLMLHR